MVNVRKKRKIAVVTGSRAEYGLLRWVIKEIRQCPDLQLQLLVTGTHLSPEFGSTISEIKNDRVPIKGKIDIKLSGDSSIAIAEAVSNGVMGFARAYVRLRPDILLILGDRFEILAAAAASLPFRMPIAHLHGGESAEGLMDEQIRHAITKMSHIHFTATEKYKRRILQMGEAPSNVFCFGAPGLDAINKLKLMPRQVLYDNLGIPQDKRAGIVTFHPVTLEKNTAGPQVRELLEALRRFEEIFWIFTAPNADMNNKIIAHTIKRFLRRYPKKGGFFTSLGQLKYFSLLKHALVMVGNSSSGLTQAPSFKLPVVNIGDRQRGRLRSPNVIDIPQCKAGNIYKAIKRAIDPRFRKSLGKMKNPYGGPGASRRIVEKLRTIKLGEGLLKKRFQEI